MFKNALKIFFITFVLILAGNGTGIAGKPAKSTTAYFIDPALPMYQMTEMQKTVVSQLKLWDRTYQRWVNEDISVPGIWQYLANEVFGGYVSISELFEGYVSSTYSGDAQSDAPFILRGMLASGISSLFAAQAFMEQGPASQAQALKAYERGLSVLEKVIRIGKLNPNIAYIPNYTTALRTSAGKDQFFMHPLAGCETILTGVSDFPMIFAAQGMLTRKPVTNKHLQSMFSDPFLPLKDYQGRLRIWYQSCNQETFEDARNTKFKQGSTITTARFFLSEFCPWGLGIYLTLKDAGLTKGLDWRILRPFAGNEPKDMSEIVIKPPKIPSHITNELNQVVGDGKSGFLDPAKKKPVQWAWVSRPVTYTVKYISPLVYERTRTTEHFSKAMGYVKWVFGGPIDYIVDATLGGLLKEVGHYYGKDSDIYNASWVLVHGNDKGLLTTAFVTKRELPGITLILKKTAGAAFAALEQQMIEDMYEGIDPRDVAMGISYNGKPIPPIMMRGDVLGFQKVPSFEYSRTIQAVRHYVLRPSAITQKNPTFPYDLSKNKGLGTLRKDVYLKEQQAKQSPQKKEVVRKNAWAKLPTPFGGRDYINDFSPTYQIFKLNLPGRDFDKYKRGLPANTSLFVQLWQKSPDTKNRLVLNERIHGPKLRLVIYNMHSPEGKSSYISADGKHISATRGIKIGNRPMHPKTYRYFGPSDYRRQPVSSLALELTNRLQTRYRLVITRGKNGRNIVDYPLVIAPGRGKSRIALTGTLKALGDGGVVLTNNIQSSSYAGMRFMGGWSSSARFKAWVQKEVKESSKGSGNKGIFSLPTFISMSFNKKGQCIIKDFKYTISRGQRIGQSHCYRKAWITTLLHFKPAPVIDPGKIKGTYTCIAGGETSTVDFVNFRTKDKKRHKNVKGGGTWTLTQQEDTWLFQIHPNQAPLSEMMVPVEAILEEE